MRSKAGEMAPSVKCLLYKHKETSSIPETYGKIPGVGAHVCNANVGAVETAVSLKLANHPHLLSVFKVSERPCLKRKWIALEEQHLGLPSDPHTCTQMHLYTWVHAQHIMHIQQRLASTSMLHWNEEQIRKIHKMGLTYALKFWLYLLWLKGRQVPIWDKLMSPCFAI